MRIDFSYARQHQLNSVRISQKPLFDGQINWQADLSGDGFLLGRIALLAKTQEYALRSALIERHVYIPRSIGERFW